MKTSRTYDRGDRWVQAGVALLFGLLVSCKPAENNRVQGYVEGEFVYVASPLAGALETLPVQRGAQVQRRDPLFALECGAEAAAHDQAERRLAEGKANLEDAKKGKRPAEIESIESQLKQARAALVLSEKEFTRQESLFRSGSSAASDFDRAKSARDQDRQRVSQLEADLQTARLGMRVDQISAAEANVRALEAALAKADWDFAQKHQAAPAAGLIYDTLYRQGEWIAAGRPVVVLLPPANIKVRAFVPETRVGTIHPGDAVHIFVDGVSEPAVGKVTYISPRAEYTPPVIYSQESRSKLVFLIEVRFDEATSAKLHPGQPVDAQIGP
jgi:HlyD family secretion protein